MMVPGIRSLIQKGHEFQASLGYVVRKSGKGVEMRRKWDISRARAQHTVSRSSLTIAIVAV